MLTRCSCVYAKVHVYMARASPARGEIAQGLRPRRVHNHSLIPLSTKNCARKSSIEPTPAPPRRGICRQVKLMCMYQLIVVLYMRCFVYGVYAISCAGTLPAASRGNVEPPPLILPGTYLLIAASSGYLHRRLRCSHGF